MNYDLKSKFPRASKDFLEANAGLRHPVLESHLKDALGDTAKRKGKSKARASVCITSFRTRLLDIDNAFGGQKFLLDAIRMSRLIEDDSPDKIDLTVKQVKVKTKKEERTEIEIW